VTRDRSGDDRRRLLERANALVARGKVEKAISALEASLTSDPAEDRVLLRLATLLRQQGEDARAAHLFGRTARIYERQGFMLRAVAVLRQAVALAPHDLELLRALADAYVRLGMARDAAGWLEALAKAHTQRNEREQALAVRRTVLGLLPADLGAAVRLADLLVQLDRAGEALRLLRRAAEAIRSHGSDGWLLVHERIADLEPGDHALALALADVLLSRGAPRRALERLKPSLATHLDDPATLALVGRTFAAMGLSTKAAAAWRELAHLRRRSGDAEGARQAWERVRELLPDDPEATVALAPRAPTVEAELEEAAFFAAQGLVGEARAILARLAEAHPLDPVIAERLGALGPATGERLDAEELVVDLDVASIGGERPRDGTTTVLNRIRAREPADRADAQAHADLAVAFLELGQHDDAVAEVERALAADPAHEARWLALLGRCHLEGGAPRDAVDAYRRALAGTGLSFQAATAVRFELGLALERTGDRDGALAQLREAARMEPGHRDVESRLAELEARSRSPLGAVQP
jgi:tetratricopeptide (TPR) repeat protein